MKTLIYFSSITLMYHLECLFIYTISPKVEYLQIASSDVMLFIGMVIALISGSLLAMEIVEKYDL